MLTVASSWYPTGIGLVGLAVMPPGTAGGGPAGYDCGTEVAGSCADMDSARVGPEGDSSAGDGAFPSAASPASASSSHAARRESTGFIGTGFIRAGFNRVFKTGAGSAARLF